MAIIRNGPNSVTLTGKDAEKASAPLDKPNPEFEAEIRHIEAAQARSNDPATLRSLRIG